MLAQTQSATSHGPGDAGTSRFVQIVVEGFVQHVEDGFAIPREEDRLERGAGEVG